jgi:phage major head subunit gpT-like protein
MSDLIDTLARAMQVPPRILRAGASIVGDQLRLTGAVTLRAAAAGETGARRFQMDAYNGGPMRFPWCDIPVVVDIVGIDLTDKSRPILKEHDPLQIVGHSTAITKVDGGARLSVDGVVSGAGDAAAEVVASADRGFPWQASIGIAMGQREEIAPGQPVTVNGQTFTGPLLIVRTSRMEETSFVALGADDSTAARMVAALQPKESHMDFTAWLQKLGFDPATLSTEQTAALQKAYDAEMVAAKASADKAGDAQAKASAAADSLRAALVKVAQLQAKAKADPKPDAGGIPADLQAARKAAADETRRVAEIRKLCAGKNDAIEAQAIEEGWTRDTCELAVLRASRAQAPAIHARDGGGNVTTDLLQVAVLQATKAKDLEKLYKPEVLEAAHQRFRGRIGLQELLLEAAHANGYHGRSFRGDHAGVLRAAFGQLQAGFSTVDTPGILSTVANKFLLDGFQSVEDVWRKIAAVRPVSDFKQVTSYRLTGVTQYEKVGPTGEIKAGALSEESYTNKADTYGKLFGISRRDMINDDLGALSNVPKMLGRGAGLKLNDVFWTEFMANAGTFYTSGRKNYQSGAGTALSITSLTAAVQLFRDQVDAENKPLGVAPALLIVPTALEVIAFNLFNGAQLVVGSLGSTSSKATEPNLNPHARKYEPVTSAYLGNTAYIGSSTTAWYLVANPADLPLIEVAFLNGQESPTIEQADADFSTLGIQMRGFHDFGVAKQDYRAAVKSAGA